MDFVGPVTNRPVQARSVEVRCALSRHGPSRHGGSSQGKRSPPVDQRVDDVEAGRYRSQQLTDLTFDRSLAEPEIRQPRSGHDPMRSSSSFQQCHVRLIRHRPIFATGCDNQEGDRPPSTPSDARACGNAWRTAVRTPGFRRALYCRTGRSANCSTRAGLSPGRVLQKQWGLEGGWVSRPADGG